MRSARRSETFDLARDLPTTAEDVAALRAARNAGTINTEEYLRTMARLGDASSEALRRRRGPRGEPFRLD